MPLHGGDDDDMLIGDDDDGGGDGGGDGDAEGEIYEDPDEVIIAHAARPVLCFGPDLICFVRRGPGLKTLATISRPSCGVTLTVLGGADDSGLGAGVGASHHDAAASDAIKVDLAVVGAFII